MPAKKRLSKKNFLRANCFKFPTEYITCDVDSIDASVNDLQVFQEESNK